jgi:hypothetical protein
MTPWRQLGTLEDPAITMIEQSAYQRIIPIPRIFGARGAEKNAYPVKAPVL